MKRSRRTFTALPHLKFYSLQDSEQPGRLCDWDADRWAVGKEAGLVEPESFRDPLGEAASERGARKDK